MPGGQQVALLNAVENDVLGPRVVLEATVVRHRGRHRFEVLVEQDLGHALLPQLGHAIPVIHLLLDDLGRVFPRLDRHVLKGLAHDCRVHHRESIVFPSMLDILVDQMKTFFGDISNNRFELFHHLQILLRDLRSAPVFLCDLHACVPRFCCHFHTP